MKFLSHCWLYGLQLALMVVAAPSVWATEKTPSHQIPEQDFVFSFHCGYLIFFIYILCAVAIALLALLIIRSPKKKTKNTKKR